MDFLLDPDTLYIIEDPLSGLESYARTPDGVGCYWYDEDQYEEAKGDISTPLRTRRFENHREWERFRETGSVY